jgi:hypothetical protein
LQIADCKLQIADCRLQIAEKIGVSGLLPLFWGGACEQFVARLAPAGFELEAQGGDEGLLDFARGRGVTVTGSQQHGTVIERARELVKVGRENGYRIEELVELVEAAAAPPKG